MFEFPTNQTCFILKSSTVPVSFSVSQPALKLRVFVDTRVSDQTHETLFQRSVFENVFVTEDDKLVIELQHDLSESSVYERRDDE